MAGVADVDLVDDLPRDAVRADDRRRRPHHELGHDAQHDRRADGERGAAGPSEVRNVLLQVVAREAEVTRLLGHVDLHDPPEQRVHIW